MAGKYEHPFPIWDARLPIFATPHQASDFLADYQGRGFIRRCAHARIGPVGERYCVSCDQNSFEVLTADEPEPYETDSGYEYALQNEFTGCPEGCRLYQPKWQAPLNRLRTSFHPVHWLERQPWQVKVALIAVPLLVVAAYFGVLRDLATLVRAIGEVWRGK